MKRNPFIKEILEKWNIQSFVMASLVFQMILVFLAPMRRRINNGFMYLVIWAVYLLASFFSTFALSLIYNNAPKEVNKFDIFPFWAPFLLVHLGGPHTITALAMEDNNLWHRHLLTQAVQVFSVSVVLYQYQIFQNEWLLPTAIVFLIGIVKCFQRIVSLHLASFNLVRGSIRRQKSPDKATATAARDKNGLDDEYEIVRRGYEFYQTFKGFIIDHTFIHNECGKEKEWFSKLDEKDAFKVMEMELEFMYQAMFTKMIAVQYWENNYFWCIWRFVCHALLETVAVIFLCHSKHHLQPADIGITYCLLGGALLLDQIALIHLIFSYWTIVKIMNYYYYDKATAAGKKVARDKILPVIYGGLKLVSMNKCWSEKIIQYSLLKHSLTGRWKWAEPKLEFFSLKEVIDSCLHTETAKVGRSLKELVFKEIKRKAKAAGPQEAGGQHGDGVKPKIVDFFVSPPDNTDDYATIVLIWHVATPPPAGKEKKKKRQNCAQYLAYLLVLEGKITSALPGSIGMRFKDICWEQAHHTFNHLYDTFNPKNAAAATGTGISFWKRTSRDKACQYLIKEGPIKDEELENNKGIRKYEKDEKLENNKGKYEKSVLPKAVKLARAMNRVKSVNTECADPEAAGNNKQQSQKFWKDLSEVWVGLLVYASSHCRGDVYYLNKGGQFYTFVRLLMAHYGLQESLKADCPFQLKNEIHY